MDARERAEQFVADLSSADKNDMPMSVTHDVIRMLEGMKEYLNELSHQSSSLKSQLDLVNYEYTRVQRVIEALGKAKIHLGTTEERVIDAEV